MRTRPGLAIRCKAAVFAAFMMLGWPALAQDETSAARAIIQSQVDAFKRDDAAVAYGLAAPAIREMFPQADVFIGMVRSAYPAVYRHKRLEFGASEVLPDGKIAQRVSIVDADDVAWEALYTLERQPDGSWKISGCVLKKVGTAV